MSKRQIKRNAKARAELKAAKARVARSMDRIYAALDDWADCVWFDAVEDDLRGVL